MKFVIYEIWTTSRIVEAKDKNDALQNYPPRPIKGLNLSNWHAVPITKVPIAKAKS